MGMVAQTTVQTEQVKAAAAAKQEEEVVPCHTCTQGDKCFNDVEWAMTVGIPQDKYDDKDWTPKITADSCFEEVQSALHTWQSLDNFDLGGMQDKAHPVPCESQTERHEMHG